MLQYIHVGPRRSGLYTGNIPHGSARVLPPGQLSLNSQALHAVFSRLVRTALACMHTCYMHCAHACCMHCVHACMACAHVSCCCQLLFSDSLLYLYESVYILDLFAMETTSPQSKRKTS